MPIPHAFFVMLVIAAVMWFVLHRSVFGRYLFAIGKNEEAARYSGIRTNQVIIAAYVICSLLTALSAIFFAMYTRSILPSGHGNFYELYAIAAAVLGGFSLRGGEGSIVGVVLGTILLQILQNLVNLLGIPSSLNFAVMGSVILIGVLADQQFKIYRERRAVAEAAREARALAAAAESPPRRAQAERAREREARTVAPGPVGAAEAAAGRTTAGVRARLLEVRGERAPCLSRCWRWSSWACGGGADDMPSVLRRLSAARLSSTRVEVDSSVGIWRV